MKYFKFISTQITKKSSSKRHLYPSIRRTNHLNLFLSNFLKAFIDVEASCPRKKKFKVFSKNKLSKKKKKFNHKQKKISGTENIICTAIIFPFKLALQQTFIFLRQNISISSLFNLLSCVSFYGMFILPKQPQTLRKSIFSFFFSRMKNFFW